MLHARCLRHNRAQSQSAVARKHPEVESGREFPSFFTPIGCESVGVDVWGAKSGNISMLSCAKIFCRLLTWSILWMSVAKYCLGSH